jgi:hypothetical protein
MVLESERSTSVPAKSAISADTRERVLYAPSTRPCGTRLKGRRIISVIASCSGCRFGRLRRWYGCGRPSQGHLVTKGERLGENQRD